MLRPLALLSAFGHSRALSVLIVSQRTNDVAGPASDRTLADLLHRRVIGPCCLGKCSALLGPQCGGPLLAWALNMRADIGRRDRSLIDHHDRMPSSDDQTRDVTFRQVVAGLDPVMVPLGFATGQGGVSGNTGQVIYCSIHRSGDGRCADVVLNLRRTDGWRIVAVSYDGFHDDDVEQLGLREYVGLPEQLDSLRTTILDYFNQWIQ